MPEKAACELANDFRLAEKVYAQGAFFGMGIFATIGIAIVDWRWVFAYLVIYAYGIVGIVMRHLVCPRCPHLFVYDDCLQAPVSVTKRIVRERKTTPFSTTEKLLFYLVFLLIPTFPIYWLLSKPLLLVGFILSAGMWYGGQFFHFCKRCRVECCPFNRVTFIH